MQLRLGGMKRYFPVVASSFVLLSATAQSAEAPQKTETAPPAEKPRNWEITSSLTGAYDSNVFNKAAAVSAAGTDAELGLKFGVPMTSRLDWFAAGTYGTNFRMGTGELTSKDALKMDASFRTGFGLVLLGAKKDPSAPPPKGPKLKLGIEGKYALTTTPLLTQDKSEFDVTADTLQPDDDDDASGEDEEAGVGSSVQTFSNPFTHHKVTGSFTVAFEPTSQLGFLIDAGGGGDFVDLTNVEVSPQFVEFSAGLSAKFKLVPKYFWVSAGYNWEHRWYEAQTAANGELLAFGTHGVKVALEFPLKPLNLKLAYSPNFKIVEIDPSTNTTRHQIQLAADLALSKGLALVVDFRVSDTQVAEREDVWRYLGVAGLKLKL